MGVSTPGDVDPTPERLLADLAQVAAALGLRRVHLVGHSLGAVLALAARSRSDLGFEIASVTSVSGTERAFQNLVMRVGAWAFGSRLGVRFLRSPRLGLRMIASWFGDAPPVEQLERTREIVAGCPRRTRDTMPRAVSGLDVTRSLARGGTAVAGGER